MTDIDLKPGEGYIILARGDGSTTISVSEAAFERAKALGDAIKRVAQITDLPITCNITEEARH